LLHYQFLDYNSLLGFVFSTFNFFLSFLFFKPNKSPAKLLYVIITITIIVLIAFISLGYILNYILIPPIFLYFNYPLIFFFVFLSFFFCPTIKQKCGCIK